MINPCTRCDAATEGIQNVFRGVRRLHVNLSRLFIYVLSVSVACRSNRCSLTRLAWLPGPHFPHGFPSFRLFPNLTYITSRGKGEAPKIFLETNITTGYQLGRATSVSMLYQTVHDITAVRVQPPA